MLKFVVIIRSMIRTQISLTEDQMRRLRAEARRRHTSIAALLRDAVERTIPDEAVVRGRRMDGLLGAAGSVASGSGTVARDHDDLLAGERW